MIFHLFIILYTVKNLDISRFFRFSKGFRRKKQAGGNRFIYGRWKRSYDKKGSETANKREERK